MLYNQTYERSGTLWEGRHKSSLVDNDSYSHVQESNAAPTREKVRLFDINLKQVALRTFH